MRGLVRVDRGVLDANLPRIFSGSSAGKRIGRGIFGEKFRAVEKDVEIPGAGDLYAVDKIECFELGF